MSTESGKAWKKRNPLQYAYNSLKDNARRRGKAFTLTFDQFKAFAVKTDYMNMRGRGKHAYHIDRIDEAFGYTLNNIQALTNTENVRKYVAFKYRDQDGPHFETLIEKPINGEDYPF